MKKLFSMLMIGAAVFAFTGCGKKTTEEKVTDEAASMQKQMDSAAKDVQKAADDAKDDAMKALDEATK